MKKVSMILALDENDGLWKGNDLPWRIKEDMKYFKEKTIWNTQEKNAVVMGRKTWESIPEKFKPLPKRLNIILSRSFDNWEQEWKVLKYKSLEVAIEELSWRDDIWVIFIIGWAQIYNYALWEDLVDTIYLTRVKWDYKCDVFVDFVAEDPKLERISCSEWKQEWKHKFRFEVYRRKERG